MDGSLPRFQSFTDDLTIFSKGNRVIVTLAQSSNDKVSRWIFLPSHHLPELSRAHGFRRCALFISTVPASATIIVELLHANPLTAARACASASSSTAFSWARWRIELSPAFFQPS